MRPWQAEAPPGALFTKLKSLIDARGVAQVTRGAGCGAGWRAHLLTFLPRAATDNVTQPSASPSGTRHPRSPRCHSPVMWARTITGGHRLLFRPLADGLVRRRTDTTLGHGEVRHQVPAGTMRATCVHVGRYDWWIVASARSCSSCGRAAVACRSCTLCVTPRLRGFLTFTPCRSPRRDLRPSSPT